nr:MAG: hypothetical protein [Picornavirales sp.]
MTTTKNFNHLLNVGSDLPIGKALHVNLRRGSIFLTIPFFLVLLHYSSAAGIFSSTHHSTQPDVLPSHFAPQQTQPPYFVTLLLLVIFHVMDRICNSKFVAHAMAQFVEYLRKNKKADSNIEKAYRTAQMFIPTMAETKKFPRSKKFDARGYSGQSKTQQEREELPPISGDIPIPNDFFLSSEKQSFLNESFQHDEDSHISMEEHSILSMASNEVGEHLTHEYDKPCSEEEEYSHTPREPDPRNSFKFNFTVVLLWIWYFSLSILKSVFTSQYVRSLPLRTFLFGLAPYFGIPFFGKSSSLLLPLLQCLVFVYFPDTKERALDASMRSKVVGNSIPDDLSLAQTTASTSSTIDSDPYLDIMLSTEAPQKRRIGALATFYEVLGEHSSAKALAYFLSGLFTAPSYSSDPVRCVVFHTRNFSSLFTDLKVLYGSKISSVLDMLEKEFQSLFDMCFWGESEDENSPNNTWMSMFAEGFEKLERFQDTPMGAVLGAGVSLISSLPILISRCYTAENWMKQWKMLCTAFKTTGGSVSTIMKSFLSVHYSVTQTDACWGSSSILSRILDFTPFYKEYAECRELYRKVFLGILRFDPIASNKFLNRLARLEKQAVERIDSKSSAYDISIAKDCTELYTSMATWVIRNSNRVVPFVIFYDGIPGTGKSTLVETIDRLLHIWKGIEDIRSTAPISLDGKTDEITTNRTTSIIIDDYGNKKGPARATGTSLTNFCVANMNATYQSVLKADLPDKGKHVYRNTFLHVIDNDPHRGVSEDLRCEFAFKRRCQNSVEIKCRPQFANPSGGLDLDAAHSTTGYGEHLLFRPYSWEKIGNETPRMKNVFDQDGFIGHLEFYKWLKATMEKHFFDQEQMLERKSASLSMPLCHMCNLMPYKFCKCGVGEECFLDPETSSLEVSSSSQARGSLIDLFSIRLRLYSASTNSLLVRLYQYSMELPLVETMMALAILTISFLVNKGSYDLAIVITCLSFSMAYLLERLRRAWRRYRSLALTELLDTHTSFLRRHSAKFGMGIAALAMLLAAPKIVNALISLLPDRKIVPQTAKTPSSDEGVDVSQTERPPSKEEQPIWRKVSFQPVVSDPRSRTVSERDLLTMIRNNTIPVKIRSTKTGETMPVYLFFLCSEIAVTVAHAFLFDADISPVDLLCEGKKPTRIETHRMFIPKGKDIMFVYLGDHFAQRKNLSIYLPDEVCQKTVLVKSVQDNFGNWSDERIQSEIVRTRYNLSAMQATIFQEQEVYRCIGSVIETGVGQCGLPYISSSISKTIAGIHAAGNKITTSYALPLLSSDYQDAITSFSRTGFKYPLHISPYILSSGTVAPESEPDLKHPVFFLEDSPSELRVEKWVAKNFTPVSSIRYNPFLQEARKHLGLRLHKDKPIMKIRQSTHKVLSSLTGEKRFGNVDLMVGASRLLQQQVLDPLLSGYVPKEHMTRPLTISEVLNGIPGEVMSAALNTSSGIGGKKSRYVMGDPGFRELVPSMCADIQNIMEILHEGGNPYIPATACLKDEARPIGKLQRLFYNPVMPQFLILSQYLRTALDFMTSHPAEFSTAIGLDPVGEQWQLIVEKFSPETFRENCFDLDYEAFDTNQSEFMRNLVDNVFISINARFWTNDSDLLMMKKVLSWANDTPVDMTGAVMRLQWLMLSGLLFTAHKNGLVTLHVVAADFIRFWASRNRDPFQMVFDDHVRLATLGDDTKAAVSNEMREAGWTQEHLIETAFSYGLTLTTASKDKNFYFKNYTECEFLKRYYTFNSYLQRNLAVLSPKSYLQPFHTYTPSKEMTLEEYQAQQAETILLEAFYDGRELFEIWKERLRNYFNAVPLCTPCCLAWDYDEMVAERNEYSVPQPQLFDIRNKGLALLKEYQAEPPTPVEIAKNYLTAEFTAESEPTETVGIHALEGEVQDEAGYANVNASVSRMPIEPITKPEQILYRRQLLRTIQLPLVSAEDFSPVLELISQPIFVSRASHMAFRATGVKLTFVTTAPATVSGCLIASIAHQPTADSASEAATIASNSMSGMSLLSQRQHVLIRLGEVSNVWHLTVPFVSPLHAHTAFDSALVDKPRVIIAQTVPVTTSVAEGPIVTIRIYAEFSGLQLYGATAAQNPANPFAETEPHPSSAAQALATLLNDAADAFPAESAMKVYRNWRVTEEMLDDASASDLMGFEQDCEVRWRVFESRNQWCKTIKANSHKYHVDAPCPSEPGYCYLFAIPPTLQGYFAKYLGAFPYGFQIATCPPIKKLFSARHAERFPKLSPRGVKASVCGGIVHVTEDDCQMTDLLDLADCFYTLRFGMDFTQEKLSTKVLRVANLAESVEKTLSGMSRPSEIIGMAGSALEKFGFSKPITFGIERPSSFFPNASGNDTADVLAIEPTCEVSPGLPTSSEDEMTFAHITRKWTYIARLQIPADAAKGLEISHVNVTPHILVEGRPACCAAPGLFHTFWRGSMEYKLEVFAPIMISLRLGVFYDPLGPAALEQLGGVREEVEDFVENMIFDSSSQQVAEFIVGYTSNYPALQTAPDSLNTMALHSQHFSSPSLYREQSHNGHFKIRVMDYVNGGMAGPMPIYAMLWARSGSDMQWAGYTGELPEGLRLPYTPRTPPQTQESFCPKATLTLMPECETQAMPTVQSTSSPVAVSPPTATPKPSFFSSFMPSSKTTVASPTSAIPTTAAPSSFSPTGKPTTGQPTRLPTPNPSTQAPVTNVPTNVPTTMLPTQAPTPICPTGKTIETVYGRGHWISPQSWSKADGTFASEHETEFIGLGNENQQIIRIGAYCAENGFYFRTPKSPGDAGAWFLDDAGTIVNLSALADQQRLSSPDPEYWGGYYAANREVPQIGQPHIVQFGLMNNVSGPKIYIGKSRMAGIPENLGWTHWTVDTAGGACYIGTNGAQGQAPATVSMQNGMRAAGPTTPANVDVRVKAYIDWLGISYNPADKYLVNILFKGTVGIPEANSWSQSKAAVQEALVIVPLPFTVSCSGVNPVFRVSILSPWTPAIGYSADVKATDWRMQSSFPKPAVRRLRDATNSDPDAETGEISANETAAEPTTHHFGGPLDTSEFFTRMLVGEQILSFRTLLKIPALTMVMNPTAFGTFYVVSEVPQPPIEGNFGKSLYGFLEATFLAWRGGFMYHYLILGNGAVEVSRVPRNPLVSSTARGVSFTDSRVNPRLSVKIPWQEPVMFAYSGLDSMNLTNMVKVHRYDNWFFSVKEFRSTAEDFSFHYFRGLPAFLP